MAGDVDHALGIDAEQVAIEREVVDRHNASPLTAAAIPAASTSGTMCAAWTNSRSRSRQIAH